MFYFNRKILKSNLRHKGEGKSTVFVWNLIILAKLLRKGKWIKKCAKINENLA